MRRHLPRAGLRAQQPRSFVPRPTNSDLAVRAAPHRLLGQPAPIAPNRVWVGDIMRTPNFGELRRRGLLYTGARQRPLAGQLCQGSTAEKYSDREQLLPTAKLLRLAT